MLVPQLLQQPEAAGQIAQQIHGRGSLEQGSRCHRRARVQPIGLDEVLERPAPLALVPPGAAQMEAGFRAGASLGEEIEDPVEVRQGVLQLRGPAGLPGLQDASQEQAICGLRGLDVVTAKSVQEGHGRLGLPLDLHLVLGEPEEHFRRELALRTGLEQLAPGVQGLFIGFRGISPFATAVQPFRQVAILRRGLGQHRQRAQQRGRDSEPWGRDVHEGLRSGESISAWTGLRAPTP